MKKYLIKNIQVVNEGHITAADVLITNGRIEQISPQITGVNTDVIEINGEGKYLFPGCIDDQVHFREPGRRAEPYSPRSMNMRCAPAR